MCGFKAVGVFSVTKVPNVFLRHCIVEKQQKKGSIKMAMINLVRHGQAAAGFGAHADPGLDDLGRAQANEVARMLHQQNQKNQQPHPKVFSSPLARAQETATPLAQLWQTQVRLEARVAEIPSPTPELAARAAWLREAMRGTWSALAEPALAWRAALLECLVNQQEDCIMFSHFVAINAAVGAAQGDDRMHVFSPDNASVTTLDNQDGQLRVVHLGVVADTHIN
tara:strand:+ start:18111 stop:18782 length:672 start_codon:yes stop_codon:yes gene_type:complete